MLVLSYQKIPDIHKSSRHLVTKLLHLRDNQGAAAGYAL
jgi:hypothetical protein